MHSTRICARKGPAVFDPILDLPPGSPAAIDVQEGRLSAADAAFLCGIRRGPSWWSFWLWRLEMAWWHVRTKVGI
jgi:hypothetical protein